MATTTIGVCTSAERLNIDGFLAFLQTLVGIQVNFVALPYNNLDSYWLKPGTFDGLILCHSINNRRFAITDVLDALYDRFLPHAKNVVGKDNVCVLVHDFPWPLNSSNRDRASSAQNHALIKEAQTESFQVRQPTTFTCCDLALISGRLDGRAKDARVEMDETDQKKLVDFVSRVEKKAFQAHLSYFLKYHARPNSILWFIAPLLLLSPPQSGLMVFFMSVFMKMKNQPRMQQLVAFVLSYRMFDSLSTILYQFMTMSSSLLTRSMYALSQLTPFVMLYTDLPYWLWSKFSTLPKIVFSFLQGAFLQMTQLLAWAMKTMLILQVLTDLILAQVRRIPNFAGEVSVTLLKVVRQFRSALLGCVSILTDLLLGVLSMAIQNVGALLLWFVPVWVHNLWADVRDEILCKTFEKPPANGRVALAFWLCKLFCCFPLLWWFTWKFVLKKVIYLVS